MSHYFFPSFSYFIWPYFKTSVSSLAADFTILCTSFSFWNVLTWRDTFNMYVVHILMRRCLEHNPNAAVESFSNVHFTIHFYCLFLFGRDKKISLLGAHELNKLSHELKNMQWHSIHPYSYCALNSPPLAISIRGTHAHQVHLLVLFKSNIAAGIKDLAKALFY